MSAPTKMNPEIKAQWVAALRSGEYKQGRGYLKALDGNVATYCCLGVLCELAVKAGIIPEADRVDPSFEHFLYGNDYTYPSVTVRAWAGLTEADPKIQVPEGTVGLSTLNDGTDESEYKFEGRPLFGRYTFQQIANLIEEQL